MTHENAIAILNEERQRLIERRPDIPSCMYSGAEPDANDIKYQQHVVTAYIELIDVLDIALVECNDIGKGR